MFHERNTLWWIALISAVLYIPFLGGIPLFDWDEVNFAEAAREMLVTGDYLRVQIDYQPFYEKPPLFFWLQAISMQLFGVNEFAARFPNAMCGIFTLCILYLLGKRFKGHQFGLLWVLTYAGSLLPGLYFHSGIIDPWFNLFIFCSVLSFPLAQQSSAKKKWMIGGGFFLGLAILTKGPVALLIVGITSAILLIIRRFTRVPRFSDWCVFGVSVLTTCCLWFGVETILHGTKFIEEFLRYQIDLFLRPGAGHKGFPGYHVVVLLLGCFPASVLAIQPLFRKSEESTSERVRDFRQWMIVLFFVVLGIFSLVESKIVHYSSLCYFPLTFLATQYAWKHINSGRAIGGWQKAALIAIALIYVLAACLLVFVGRNPEWISDQIKDVNTIASLSMDVNWQWYHLLPAIFLIGMIGVLLSRFRGMKTFVLIYILSLAFIEGGVHLWIGKIQQYSQGPATEYFQSLAGKDVYVIPWGHKSYSHFWDFQKPAPTSAEIRKDQDVEFLLSGDVDKDVFVVMKAGKESEFLQRYSEFEKVDVKGGFLLYHRKQ